MRHQIQLSGHVFDPIDEPIEQQRVSLGKAALDMHDAPADAPVYHIVQFADDISVEKRTQVAVRHGFKLDEYVPERAYLARLTPDQGRRVDAEPEVRVTRPLSGRHKISATIGRRRYVSDERRKAGVWFLWVKLAHGSSPSSVDDALKQIGATDIVVLDDRAFHGWLRLRFRVPVETDLLPLAEHPLVRAIGEDDDQVLDNGTTAGTLQSGTPGTTPVWAQGLHGEGQIIGITDSVVDIGHCWFADAAPNTPGPAHRKVVNIRNASADGSGGHGTFVAGIAIGDDMNNPGADANRGNAWAARCTFSNSADVRGGGLASVLSYLNAAALDGAFIHTNSWHDEPTPEYSQVASDVDTFVWNNEDHLVLGSSGNVGEAIGPPGTAKNALCISATLRDPNEMNFGDGNNGPTADTRPRRKPDLFAPGCAITSALNNTACNTGGWPGSPNVCATSWATPAAAAAAALVRQYYTEGWYPTGTKQPHHAFIPSGALMKATLINSAIDMTGIGGYGGNQEGFGLIRLDNVLHFSGDARRTRVWDTRNADGLLDGQQRTHRLDVASNTEQLRVALVWSDPPAAADSTDPYVNDLDLTVTSPDGTQLFRGNNFGAVGTSVAGGVADNANNVELVVIDTPVAGDWAITVTATDVNVGNPGQGYAIVAAADLPAPPETTGTQDTLVVRAKFSDLAFEPSLPNLQSTMVDVADYIAEVSWGEATISPNYRIIELDHPKSYYYHPSRDLLIELTNDVVAKLEALEPNLFVTGPNDIDRLVIVTNDVNFTESVGTTGEWPYELPAGFTRPISVSVHGYAAPVERFTSGILHQFGMVDLFAHEGVVFPRAYVDEWDALGGLFTGVHPLMWQKERAGWVAAAGATTRFIPRPAAGSSYGGMNPIGILNQNSTANGRKAIAIGLSEGATTRAAERAYYWVEARDNTLGDADGSLPDSGVVVYYVNEDVPQGEGPVILLDRSPGTATLADAALKVGDSRSIPGTGITITVQAGTGGNDYNIDVAYTPPVTDYNVRITRGDTINGQFYSYYSPDIWVDSPANGYNLPTNQPAHEDREQPIVGQINKIRARVRNDGPGTAFDFDVKFRVSEPYHTVGGDADFDKFVGIKHIDSLASGASEVASVDWTPDPGDDPHTCVRVDLINLVGTDTNPNDNWAQENLREVTSTSASPFHPVEVPWVLKNPYGRAALFYFRADHVPPGWEVELTPRKIWLGPGEKMTGTATITPPLKARPCIDQRIEITSWTPRGITLIQVGGTSVQVQLRRPTELTLEIEGAQCDEGTHKRFIEYFEKQFAYLGKFEREDRAKWLMRLLKQRREAYLKHYEQGRKRGRCLVAMVSGCMNPHIPFQEIVVTFTSPTGEKIYQTVVTDENGCYEAMHVDVNGGAWIAEVTYRGYKCQSEVSTGPRSACIC
jgi:hypothetical protein